MNSSEGEKQKKLSAPGLDSAMSQCVKRRHAHTQEKKKKNIPSLLEKNEEPQ